MSDVPAARGGAPGGGGVLVLEHEGMETKNRLSTMRFFGYLELAGGARTSPSVGGGGGGGGRGLAESPPPGGAGGAAGGGGGTVCWRWRVMGLEYGVDPDKKSYKHNAVFNYLKELQVEGLCVGGGGGE